MLHWRRKVRRGLKRYFFWGKLLVVSFLTHSFLLFFILFLYKGHFFSYNVTVNSKLLQSGAPVIFLPFCKRVASKTGVVVSSPKKVIKKIVVKPKIKKQTTLTAQSKPKKKETPKKSLKKQKTKKVAKKIEKTKKNTSKKEEKKVVKNKKIKTENKKVVKKKKPIKTVDNKTEKKPIKKLQGNLKKVDHVQQEVEGLSPVYVGQEEMAALTMQKELQQEVGKCWRPPVGLPKDLVCILKVLVDWSGKVNQAAVQKGSGVLMYDISARTAVAKMQLQKKAYGKEFTITFKQQMETV